MTVSTMLIFTALLALAAQPEAAPPPRPPAPAKPAAAPPTVPSLDDLLGTKPQPPVPAPKTDLPAPPPTPADATPDPDRAGLDRLLTGAEIGDAFQEAITLMGDAAKRLETSRDTGLATQRVQEDVVRRLDQLLASLQRQQSSSSSSSSQSQSQQDSQQNRNQPNQNQRRPGQRPGQQSQSGSGDRDWDGPPKQEGALKPALDSARAAWGSLPARVRDMLLQGSEDPFSASYKAMTEAYYRKLAEERK
ncbi:MAG: hypothetical protein ACK4WH_02865 [Phycisphaerales bacterium]